MAFYLSVAEAKGLEKYEHYNVQDNVGSEQMGLVEEDWTPKQVFCYYRTFMNTIGLCETVLTPASVGTFTPALPGTMLEKHCFEAADGSMYVSLWNALDGYLSGYVWGDEWGDAGGPYPHADTVDIVITDTTFVSVKQVNLSTGVESTVSFTRDGSDRIVIADLPVSFDPVLLVFSKEAGAVVISGIDPNSGVAGSTVTITGTGFGAAQGDGEVSFNG